MSFLIAVKAFNFGHVSVFFFYRGNNIDTRGRGVGVTTLSHLPSVAPGTSLVVLVFLQVGVSLLSRRGLFSTRRVSREGVGGLILSTGVLFLRLSGPVPSGTSRVHVAGTGGGLEYRLYLRVDGFLHDLFPGVQVPVSGIYLGPDRRFQAFQEASDHDPLVRSCTGIKLSEDRLQVLQVGCPVEDFLLLVLGVPLELSPVGVHKGLGVTKATAEECLEFVLCDRDRGFGVISPLVLLSAEADPVSQEERSKKNLGWSHSFSGSKIVLTLLTEVVTVQVGLSAIYIRGTSLQLLPGCLGNNGNWSGSGSGNRSKSGNRSSSLQNSLKNPLQVIFGVFKDTSSSRSVSNGGFQPQGSNGLVGQFITQLGGWRGIRGSDRGSNRGSDGGMLVAGTSTASDRSHLGADFF